ncbi:MAG: hypothetical protein AAGE85_17880, partial [Pseudomonadota bacterium]
AVERVNDSLNFIRAFECQQSGAVRAELMTICDLFLAGQLDEAAKAIADYHACRRTRTPELLAAYRQ